MTTQSLRPLVAGLVACSIGPFAWGADSMSKASIEKEAFGVTADGIAVERRTPRGCSRQGRSRRDRSVRPISADPSRGDSGGTAFRIRRRR